MKAKFSTIVMAAAALLAMNAAVRAETAAESFAKGERLLTKGDLDGALTAYADATRADRSNQEYVQHYAILRRVLQLRKGLDAEQDLARWENTARALHSFYVSEKLYSEALSLGLQTHRKLNNEWSAVTLAETQLAISRNEDATKTLSALGPKKSSPTSQALLGIALVRIGQVDRAKEVAKSVVLPDETDVQATYAAARLWAAVGDSAKALKLLEQCLRAVPPSGQDGFKEHAKRSPEFAAVASNAAFAKTLGTESAVPESKCSGGKSCAGCPMRGKCPHSQGSTP
jgi:tetratricopeptide (TPR) repeat protein